VAGRLKETAQSGALFVLPSSLDSSSMAVSLRSAHPQAPPPHQGALLGWHGHVADDEAASNTLPALESNPRFSTPTTRFAGRCLKFLGRPAGPKTLFM